MTLNQEETIGERAHHAPERIIPPVAHLKVAVVISEPKTTPSTTPMPIQTSVTTS